jgi:ubiquinone/menaquinone biosynthesis C-methylase UbiE
VFWRTIAWWYSIFGVERSKSAMSLAGKDGPQGHAGDGAGDTQEEIVVRTMDEYDMVENPDESYYAQQYLHWILPEMSARFPGGKAEILDLGCGQGRLSIPLARWCTPGGGRVTAADLTPSAVERARRYAENEGLDNVVFHEAEALGFARGLAEASTDAILLIEVTFFMPAYREVVKEMARVVRPGGVVFCAFRSQHYNLLQTVQGWRWESARMVLDQREGPLWGEPVMFTWQTPEEIGQLMEGVGLRLWSLRGIGVCSGLENDPLGQLMRPSWLSREEQDRLMAIECAAAERFAACGRYILATAEKPAG